VGKNSHFLFELSWLRQEGFFELVKREWCSVDLGITPVDKWQNKVRHLRQFLRGWARNLNGEYKKEKEKLLSIIDTLDIKAESVPLTRAEREKKKEAGDRLAKMRRDEESKWAQRAKVKYIQEGGNNTKYFHLIANGKHRKKKKIQLEQDEGTIVGEANLRVFIREYYKKLFGQPEPNFFSMVEENTNDILQISTEESEILTTNFTEEEVKEAIMQMQRNKAPGPDGLPAEFYQVFWEVIKGDLMDMLFSYRHASYLCSG
jgi:hypothetical protein